MIYSMISRIRSALRHKDTETYDFLFSADNSEDKGLVSVILPTHNGSRHIRNSIDSVLNQTYGKLELIIINDASSDDTLDIINSYEDKRITVYTLQENSHICYALNYGLSKAKGEYVARIDDDDIWISEKLEHQIAFLDNNREYAACFTQVEIIDSDGEILEESPMRNTLNAENKTRREWVRYFFTSGNCLCHPSVVFRKQILDDVGNYDLSLVQLQDFEFWTRIVKKYPIHVLEARLTHYRWDATNMSAPSEEVNRRTDREFKYVLSKYLDDINDDELIAVFSNDFIDRRTVKKEELDCERALLLLSKSVVNSRFTREAAIMRLFSLINDREHYNVLKSKYKFTQMNLYQLSGEQIN